MDHGVTADPRDVVVVGAGPAGLAVAGCLAPHRVRALVLERGAAPGWSWRQHYAGLRLHTPRGLSSMPGARLAAASPYPGRDELLAHLERWTAERGVEVACGNVVESVRREGERWRVATAQRAWSAAAVVIATGAFGELRQPAWPGSAGYQGRWLRPVDLESPGESWRGRAVLVVGLGNTGADAVTELHARGARVAVAVRGPLHVLPRDLFGVNLFRWNDLVLERLAGAARRLGEAAGDHASDAVAGLLWRVQEQRFGDLRERGLRLADRHAIRRRREASEVPSIAGPWVDLVRRGDVRVLPEVRSITSHGARFADGREAGFEAILLATGYAPGGFPLARKPQAPARDGAVAAQPGLWLCGTAPGLRHIRRSAPRLARAIARQLRHVSPPRRDG